jgi:hypothetical protein
MRHFRGEFNQDLRLTAVGLMHAGNFKIVP